MLTVAYYCLVALQLPAAAYYCYYCHHIYYYFYYYYCYYFYYYAYYYYHYYYCWCHSRVITSCQRC